METYWSRQNFDRKHSYSLACGVRGERNRDGKINETSVAKIALLESQDVDFCNLNRVGIIESENCRIMEWFGVEGTFQAHLVHLLQ